MAKTNIPEKKKSKIEEIDAKKILEKLNKKLKEKVPEKKKENLENVAKSLNLPPKEEVSKKSEDRNESIVEEVTSGSRASSWMLNEIPDLRTKTLISDAAPASSQNDNPNLERSLEQVPTQNKENKSGNKDELYSLNERMYQEARALYESGQHRKINFGREVLQVDRRDLTQIQPPTTTQTFGRGRSVGLLSTGVESENDQYQLIETPKRLEEKRDKMPWELTGDDIKKYKN